MPKFAASVAMMFNERDLLDRFEEAANMGFEGVEIQAPYGESATDIASRVKTNNLTATLMNVPVAAGAIPGREDEFRQGLTRAFEYAQASASYG